MIAELCLESDKDSFCIEIERAKYRVGSNWLTLELKYEISTGHVTEVYTRKICCCNTIVKTLIYRTW